MKKVITLSSILLILLVGLFYQTTARPNSPRVLSAKQEPAHWLLLHRKSNQEFLYIGEPGNQENSTLIKSFQVKSGIPGERPTPLPNLLEREYWVITEKLDTTDDPETSPYFLTLDIPVTEEEPYGPVPYKECVDPTTGEARQCNWILPGAFGLHGVAGDSIRMSPKDLGSSGCIRHLDEDITFLYNLLNPDTEEIRYYVEDV